MADTSGPKIPRPTPFEEVKLAEIPEELQPPPAGPLRVTQVIAGGTDELAVLFKRTYVFDHAQPCVPADEQPALCEDAVPHDEMTPGIQPSYKTIPEVVGYKRGTDVVVQAAARPPGRVSEMQVEVRIGAHRHSALVLGKRLCEVVGGKLAFSAPEPFEEMSLRHENAYGGTDWNFFHAVGEELAARTSSDVVRRTKAIRDRFLADGHLAAYPRNRFGKGYVIDGRMEFVEGRELPNLERPEDRLTPENLVVGNPMTWNKQPLPVGFDYMDLITFPRVAMLGLPPGHEGTGEPFREVARGLVPRDFSRGSWVSAQPTQVPNLLHPDLGRCASLGLQLPFLEGRETVVLSGMDPEHPAFEVVLPGERPVFEIPALRSEPMEIDSELYQITIDLDQRTLGMIWCGRAPLKQSLPQKTLNELQASVMMTVKRS